MAAKEQGWNNEDRRPIPDPTLLTTQALLREIAGVRELYDTRLAAMDKAVALLQAFADRSPTIGELSAKHEQMFIAVNQRIEAIAKVSEESARLYLTLEAMQREQELREQWQQGHTALHVSEGKALTVARDGDAKAVEIARGEINQRLEAMNELRAQITTERGNYVLREYYDREHESLRHDADTRLKLLENGSVKSEAYQQSMTDWAHWRDTVNAALNRQAGISATWGTVSSLVVGLVVLLLSHFWK